MAEPARFRFPSWAGAVCASSPEDLYASTVLYVTVHPLLPDTVYVERERKGAEVRVELDPADKRGHDMRDMCIPRGPYKGAEARCEGWMDAADADGYRVKP